MDTSIKSKPYTESAQLLVEKASALLKELGRGFKLHNLEDEETIINAALIAIRDKYLICHSQNGAAVTIDRLKNQI